MLNVSKPVIYVLIIFSLVLLPACGIAGEQVEVSIVYGSEKEEWLEPLVNQFNSEKHKTEDGATIVVSATPMGSIESVNAIISGEIQPTVWSPASSVYVPVANAEWRKLHASDLIEGTPNDLVLSPVIIAMWQPMAEALGWPEKSLGWQDISQLAISDEGWSAFGYPEWGDFQFGHTHPNYSNSGIVSIIAEAYAGAGKQRGLTLEDLQNNELQQFMSEVESSIIHYGTSTGFFANRMFERGPSYLSAAVMYENLVVAQENKRLSGQSSQLPVVAIYPREGTFWSNHPYAVLNAPWVSDNQKEAANIFEAFLLDRPQQERAIELGFRPADPSIPLAAPLDQQHGVDISQPKTVLEVPPAEVIAGIQSLWREVKKPVDLVVVLDTSGSMEGDKISSARGSLVQFIDLLDDRDRLKVVIFNTELLTLSELSPVGDKRDEIKTRVSGIVERGGTRLYDATLDAYQDMQEEGDPKHIRAVVVLSDGMDTDSEFRLQELMNKFGAGSEEGGKSIKVFTIAFGGDADADILQQIAESTGGKVYTSDPTTISEIYAQIATFF
ncbi:MAG: VWA domain-containing protein [Anaerolineales bacterium]|jgi:Ca-activated chloride channel family protein